MLTFRDGSEEGEVLRTAELQGCKMSAPKNAREGHEIAIRVDLASEDSQGDVKYILAVRTETERGRWERGLAPYSQARGPQVDAPETIPTFEEAEGETAVRCRFVPVRLACVASALAQSDLGKTDQGAEEDGEFASSSQDAPPSVLRRSKKTANKQVDQERASKASEGDEEADGNPPSFTAAQVAEWLHNRGRSAAGLDAAALCTELCSFGLLLPIEAPGAEEGYRLRRCDGRWQLRLVQSSPGASAAEEEEDEMSSGGATPPPSDLTQHRSLDGSFDQVTQDMNTP